MLEKFATFRIQNTKTIYGGTNGDGEPIESISLSYGEIPVTTTKKKSK